MPRELGYILQSSLDENALWYVDDAGMVGLCKLLTAFATFYGEHAEHWLRRFDDYREAAPQLILKIVPAATDNSDTTATQTMGLANQFVTTMRR